MPKSQHGLLGLQAREDVNADAKEKALRQGDPFPIQILAGAWWIWVRKVGVKSTQIQIQPRLLPESAGMWGRSWRKWRRARTGWRLLREFFCSLPPRTDWQRLSFSDLKRRFSRRARLSPSANREV